MQSFKPQPTELHLMSSFLPYAMLLSGTEALSGCGEGRGNDFLFFCFWKYVLPQGQALCIWPPRWVVSVGYLPAMRPFSLSLEIAFQCFSGSASLPQPDGAASIS